MTITWIRLPWRETIHAARERGFFTWQERWCAWADWTTCAVGEQKAHYPTVVVGCLSSHDGPVDPVLYKLGNAHGFAGAVWHNRFDEAEDLLNQIEDRVLELKRGS